jgi:hypothetical protein
MYPQEVQAVFTHAAVERVDHALRTHPTQNQFAVLLSSAGECPSVRERMKEMGETEKVRFRGSP